MRQMLDMLVWLAMISVVAAVIYFTPRFGQALATMGSREGQELKTYREITPSNSEITNAIR